MNLDQFVAANAGRYLDFDRAFGAQCVDLVQFYLRDVLGDPPLGGNAINEFGEDSPHWTWVRNNPKDLAQLPAKGDVMIWGPDARIGTGVYGHTAVVLAADRNGFTSFDQNWPLTAPCHQVRHVYEGIIGWGVPKAKPSPTPAPTPPKPAAPPVTPPVNPPIVSPSPLPPQEVPPVAITPPPAPIEIPEPAPVAEAGVTTSEWKVLVGFVVQEAAAGTGLLIAKLGGQIDTTTLQVVGGVEVSLLVLAVSWIVGRSLRKLGTTA